MKKIKKICVIIILVMSSCFFTSCDDGNNKTIFNYKILDDNTVEITDCFCDVENCVIPNEIDGYLITKIGDYSFSRRKIKSLTIPSNITSIGKDAFCDCYNLITITFEGESKLTTIDEGAFSGCDNLTNFEIPNSLTTLGLWVFSGCSSLKCSEYDNAYYYGNSENPYFILYESKNTGLTSCKINENTKIIADLAFRYCRKLINIDIPENVVYVGESAFEGCESLESITIPFVGVKKEPLDTDYEFKSYFGWIFGQAQGMFEEDKNLCLPETLKKVTITGGTKIPKCAFYNCKNITEIVLPKSLTSIEEGAFHLCKNLETVYFAGTIEDWFKIDKKSNPLSYASCFYILNDNNEYYEITNIEIENGTTSIGASQFYALSKVESIILPDSITSIDEWAFAKCQSLKNITIPENVKTIGEAAFEECSSLTDIEIPNGITSIEEGTFYFCKSLKNVTIPKSITHIEPIAFEYCYALENVYYNGTIKDWCKIEFADSKSNPMSYASHFYMLNENNEYYEVTEIVIPNEITSIGKYQFLGFNNITLITIPESVTSIGEYAFKGCSGLTSITIPFVGAKLNGNENTHFGYIFGAYSELENSKYIPENLKEVIIIDISNINYRAFWQCDSIVNITIPDNVTSIEDSAFYGCRFKNVYYNGTLEDWCNIVFEERYSNPMNSAVSFYMKNENNEYYEVTEIIIPNEITSIGKYQFSGFGKVTNLFIHDGVTKIGDFAFDGCYSLTNVTIPKNVTNIDYWAFAYCKSIYNVYYLGDINNWSEIIIGENNTNLTDANRYYYAETKPAEEGNYWHYDIDGITPIIW